VQICRRVRIRIRGWISVGGGISGKQKGRRVAPTALRMVPVAGRYRWDTSRRRGRPCFAAVVPSEIGDQGANTAETGHGWNPRTRAFPAMFRAWVAYMRVFMLLAPFPASNIRAVIGP
jgi:hypothetical protein